MKPFYLQDMLPFVFLNPNSCFKAYNTLSNNPKMTPNV